MTETNERLSVLETQVKEHSRRLGMVEGAVNRIQALIVSTLAGIIILIAVEGFKIITGG